VSAPWHSAPDSRSFNLEVSLCRGISQQVHLPGKSGRRLTPAIAGPRAGSPGGRTNRQKKEKLKRDERRTSEYFIGPSRPAPGLAWLPIHRQMPVFLPCSRASGHHGTSRLRGVSGGRLVRPNAKRICAGNGVDAARDRRTRAVGVAVWNGPARFVTATGKCFRGQFVGPRC